MQRIRVFLGCLVPLFQGQFQLIAAIVTAGQLEMRLRSLGRRTLARQRFEQRAGLLLPAGADQDRAELEDVPLLAGEAAHQLALSRFLVRRGIGRQDAQLPQLGVVGTVIAGAGEDAARIGGAPLLQVEARENGRGNAVLRRPVQHGLQPRRLADLADRLQGQPGTISAAHVLVERAELLKVGRFDQGLVEPRVKLDVEIADGVRVAGRLHGAREDGPGRANGLVARHALQRVRRG